MELWRRAFQVGSLSAAVVSAVACGGEPEVQTAADGDEGARAGGMAVVCTQAAFESLNPFVSPDLGAADLRVLLFTPLALYGGGTELEPHLAAQWTWEANNTRLLLALRRDVRWHDGTPVTAADVAWTLGIAANPEYGYLSDDFAQLSSAEPTDSFALTVEFEEPVVAGMESFVNLPILPRHLLGDLSGEEFQTADYHRSPVGSGPFRVAQRRPDGMIILEAVAEYPDGLGAPHLERIALRTITEPAAILTELQNGSVDYCVTTSGLAARAQEARRLEMLTIDPPQTQVLPLNTRRAPLGDVRVRRAISAALNRSEVAGAVSSVARPAQGPLPETNPFFSPNAGQPDANPGLADSLLAAAGWPAGAERTEVRRNAAGEELRIRLVSPQGSETALTVVQEQLRRVGVRLELEFMEWASYVPLLMDPGSRPAAMWLSFSPEKILHPASDLFSQLHSEGFSNLASYSNREMDSLLERLSSPLPAEERRQIISEVLRIATRDVPTLYITHVPRLALVGPRLRGVEVDLNGPYSSAARWWIPPSQRRTP